MTYKSILCVVGVSLSLSATAEVAELALSLEDCRELVIMQNLETAAQKLQLEAAQTLYKSQQKGFWEPVLVLSGKREQNERENNTEQFISQGVDDFEELNTVYEVALEQPMGTGGNVQLSYVLRDLKNNLREQRELEGSEREYEGFIGVVLTQPLLRNAGIQLSRETFRMAREESEAAFQEWRRQMMQSIGSAEAAYWDLEIAQRRVELRKASVRVAEKVLEDNRARRDAGRGAEVEVQQAEAGLAVRQTQLLEARQGVVEASNRLRTFISESIRTRNLLLKATDTPELREVVADPLPLYDEAMMSHPDILIRQHRLAQQQIRRDFARNQRLPEVNLTGSYGYNSLGDSSSEAASEAWDSEYVAWSVG
ncbi:MAG: TolC family protein, partial [Kiritimatiellae bacterium]|nr:TolC family protein [Kiritimatiellia bacterium]